jgi:hypothetical protein
MQLDLAQQLVAVELRQAADVVHLNTAEAGAWSTVVNWGQTRRAGGLRAASLGTWRRCECSIHGRQQLLWRGWTGGTDG